VVGSLEQHKFHKVVVTREPRDMLLSVLHQCLLHGSTAKWLDGEGGSERGIIGAVPSSEQFSEYVTSPRAKALVEASSAWSRVTDCVTVTYDTAVSEPVGTLTKLLEGWSLLAKRPLEAAVKQARSVEGKSLSALGWPEVPGVWRALLPNSDCSLTVREADDNWLRIVATDLTAWHDHFSSVKQSLSVTKETIDQLRVELKVMKMKFELSQRALGDARPHPLSPLVTSSQKERDLVAQLEQAQLELGRLRAQVKQGVVKIPNAPQVGANSLALAVRIHNWAVRYPRLAKIVKRLVIRRAA
jgi:hypothetical protein